jgi:hypothetical protein
MKKSVFFFFFLTTVIACNNSKDGPDISGINVDLKWHRFDQDFLSIDTNNIRPGLDRLFAKYPALTNLYLRDVLGLDSGMVEAGIRQFRRMSERLFDTINIVFRQTNSLEKEFKQAFRYLKYYFPGYATPAVATIAGPMDALAQSESGPTPDFLRPGLLGISLQFYLGKDFSVYSDPFFIENVAPLYRSRRFSKEFMVADAMKLVISDLFPDQSNGKPLVEQMIEKGKQWYLLDKLMPGSPDSIITGYTQEQLDWCENFEGVIWSTIVKNEDLNSINPIVIQTYIGEGPFTQGFSREKSPGNLGQWLGWRIVQKFVDKNSNLKPEDVMKMDARKILEEAKYKPK